MKKKLSGLLFIMLCCITISINAATRTVTIGNFQYELDTDTEEASVKGLASTVTSLVNVNIPNSVTYSGTKYTVTKIARLAFSNSKSKISGTLSLPKALKEIEYCAFSDCENLSGTLLIPDGLTSIGENAFDACLNFTGELKIPSSVNFIGVRAFRDCTGFTGTLRLPEGVTVGSCAFEACTGFTSLELPSTATIGGEAFRDCKNMSGTLVINGNILGIVYGMGWTTAGRYFLGCGFSTVILNLTYVPAYTFQDCKKLETVILKSTDRLGKYSFFGCENLKNIICTSETPPTPDKDSNNKSYCSFSNYYPPQSSQFPYNSANVYVPDGSIDKYKKVFEWKTFINYKSLSNLPEKFTFDKQLIKMAAGSSEVIVPQFYPEDTDKTLIWSSKDETIAIVNDGLVTGMSSGKTTITATTINGLSASCEVSVWMKGDVNNDGVVNIADVTLTSNYIAGLEPNNFSVEAADINDDGEITVTDAVLIARLILDAESSPAQSIRKVRVFGSDSGIMNACRDGNYISLSIPKSGFTAFQADLRLPEDVNPADITLCDNYSNSHVIMTADKGDNIVRLVVFSQNNTEFMSGENIVRIALPDSTIGAIEGCNIIASDNNGITSSLSLSGNDVESGVEIMTEFDGISIIPITEAISVKGANRQRISCFTIDGRCVTSMIADSDNVSIPLPNGIYIINAGNCIKKVIIK